ncbi:MAG: hypothetical protein HFE41_05720 [Clostridia bacterium]|jgi:hypothetical protein|nr:hypothetical protein [Clostridia bacterium]
MYELNSNDINNLKQYLGKSLSYAKLCKLFNQPQHSHNSKTSQIKQWGNYINLIKKGTQYQIFEIYDTPAPQKLKFSDYVTAIALFSEKTNMKKSMLDFQYYFGFTNSNYIQFRKTPNDDKDDKNNEVLKNFLKDYKSILYIKFNEVKKSLISAGYDIREYMIISDTTEEGDEIDEFDYHRKRRYPTPQELSAIKEIEDGILEQLKCKDKRGLLIQKKNSVFYRRLNIALRNAYSIEYRYTEYEFINKQISDFGDLYEHYKKFKKSTETTPLSAMALDKIHNYIIPFDCMYNSCIQYITKNKLVQSNQDIKNYINNFRYSLNNSIIKLVRKHNKKAIDNFQNNLNEKSNIATIVDTLKMIYGEIDEQQYVKKYEELLESYIDKYVKLTPQTDIYNSDISINDFFIINEVLALLETYPDSYTYLNN